LFLIDQAETTLPSPPDFGLVKAICLRDLGLLNLSQGRPVEARKSIDAALDIQMNKLSGVDPVTIETLLALGQVCADANQPGEAEFVMRQATIFLRHHYGDHHPAVVRAQALRAKFRLDRSEYGPARRELEDGLEMARVPGKSRKERPVDREYLPTRETVSLLTWRGEIGLRAIETEKDLSARRKLVEEAIQDFVSAERVFDTIRSATTGEEDKILVVDRAPEFSAGLLAAYLRKNDIAPGTDSSAAIFAAFERSTARGLLSAIGRQVSTRLRGVSEADLAKERELLIARDNAGKRFNRIPYNPKASQMNAVQREAWEAFQKSIDDISEFHNKLHPSDGPDGQSPIPPCSMTQALELLGENEAALTFVLGTRESFAVVLTRDPDRKTPTVTLHRLPASRLLDEKIAALLEFRALASNEVQHASEELHDVLLGPLAGRISMSNLLIIPTGALCRLPFELLREPSEDGRRYIGETRTVRYAPSLTTLHMLQRREQLNKSRSDRAFWAMANPRDPVKPDTASELATLPSLDGAVSEVKRIAGIFSGGDPAPLLLETDASRAAILKASGDHSLRRYRYLHFATHGMMEDEAHPAPGLVLARGSGEEGYLDTEDVSHLDLNADLVVLSACESGRGRIFNGEGVKGLSSAFLIAGARGVVCSLWKVDDEETARFMEAFYRRLRAGDSPAVALKQIRRAAAKRQASPEWSAFILVGGVSP
jgi:CHAT domain-containing protein